MRSPGPCGPGLRVCRALFLLEAVVHTRTYDVELQIDIGRHAAGKHAAGRVAEIGIEILELGRPSSGKNALDADAHGPARIGVFRSRESGDVGFDVSDGEATREVG